MADGFKVTFDNKALLDRLASISNDIEDLSPAMLAIGEVLSESTKDRFETSTAPDGSPWAKNAPLTVLDVHERIINSSKSKNRFANAAVVSGNKKPLIDSGLLRDSIRYQLTNGGKGVEIGTDRFAGEWEGGAAALHFGTQPHVIKPKSKKALAFNGVVVKRVNHPGLPARPFLGISEADEKEVLEILNVFLAQAFR